jgi:hypothetical protein
MHLGVYVCVFAYFKALSLALHGVGWKDECRVMRLQPNRCTILEGTGQGTANNIIHRITQLLDFVHRPQF